MKRQAESLGMADGRVSRETALSEGARVVPPRRDDGEGCPWSTASDRHAALSSPGPSPLPLRRGRGASVAGRGGSRGGDARSHGEDGFALERDRGCDGRPAVHRALRCASGAARFVGNVLAGWCGRAGHGPSLPLRRARGSPENAAVEQAGCRGWVPPPPCQTSSPSVTCRESGARAELESECRRGGARPVCQSACPRGHVSGEVVSCDSSELEGPNGGARRTVLLCIPVYGVGETPAKRGGRTPPMYTETSM